MQCSKTCDYVISVKRVVTISVTTVRKGCIINGKSNVNIIASTVNLYHAILIILMYV